MTNSFRRVEDALESACGTEFTAAVARIEHRGTLVFERAYGVTRDDAIHRMSELVSVADGHHRDFRRHRRHECVGRRRLAPVMRHLQKIGLQRRVRIAMPMPDANAAKIQTAASFIDLVEVE